MEKLAKLKSENVNTSRTILVKTIVACILLVGAMSEWCLFCAAEVAKSEWHLVQTSEELGVTDAYISHDSAKVIIKRFDCELLIKAPDWKVHCYRPTEKVEWVGNLTLFDGSVMSSPFAVPRSYNPKPLESLGRGDIKQLKYTRYATERGKQRLMSWLCTADEIATAPKIAEFLSRLYCVPNIKQVPLVRVITRKGSVVLPKKDSSMLSVDSAQDLRTGLVRRLNTISWKKMPFNAADFATPQGYKRLPDVIQVSYSKNRKSEMNDMLDSIGFTAESNELTKHSNSAHTTKTKK